MDSPSITMDHLARLVEDHATLSLSGPFSAHIEKATVLLEQRYKDMEQKGINKEQLEKIQDSLDLMKRRLELVTKAEEQGLKEMEGPRGALAGENIILQRSLISSVLL